jgi:ABC-type cobalamin/Fe3+-siderophores transport systems, ATPase components
VLEFADRSIETLSGGERQRVLIAAALAQQPEILLLDEPATFLDYRHQQELYGFLRAISDSHEMTVIEITHDINRAISGATRVLALVDGRLIFDGTPTELTNPELLQTIYGVMFHILQTPQTGETLVFPA